MYHRPPRTLGLLVGAVISLWAAAVALVLLDGGLSADVGLRWFASYAGAAVAAALALLFAYWTYGLATLSYALDRKRPRDRVGADATGDPPRARSNVSVPGTSLGVPRVSGVSWWGHHVGRARIERIGDVLFYSAHQAPEQVLYVLTAERNYAISVDDPARFAQEIQVRQELGPTGEVTHHVERAGAAAHAFWNDRLALTLALLAIVAGALPWLQLALRYGDLAATLEIYFPPSRPQSIVTVVGRDAIFELPRTASLMLGPQPRRGAGAVLVGPGGWLRRVHRRRRGADRLLRRHRHRTGVSAPQRARRQPPRR